MTINKMLIDKIDIDHLTEMILRPNSWWAWCIQDGKHWITNRHFVLIFDVEAMEEDEYGWMLSDCLEQKFEKKTPAVGKQLVCEYDFVAEKLGQNDKTIADSLKERILSKPSKNLGTVTPLIYAKKDFRNRWLKFPTFNLFVQDDYISVLYDATKEEVYSEGFNKPLFLCDGQFIILPVVEVDNAEVTDELIAFESLPDLQNLNVLH